MQEILDNLKAFHKAGMDEYEDTKYVALVLGKHKALQDVWESFDKTFCAAEKAVEKQIPKNPWFDVEDWCCPVCGVALDESTKDNHCYYCGQAILWESD